MNDFRAIMLWLGRVLANALAGGLVFAIVGAFCGALTGAVLGVIFSGDISGAFFAFYGAVVGASCGIVGLFIPLFSVVGAPSDDFWQPFYDLTPRIAFGQFWGTVFALTSFLTFELIDSAFQRVAFAKIVREDAIFICFFAPAMMICGAIAAAILKRD